MRHKTFILAPRQKKSSPKGSPKKGGKKRNPWSDESDAEDSVSDISDEDNDGSFLGTYIPREDPRRAAGWSHYSFD